MNPYKNSNSNEFDSIDSSADEITIDMNNNSSVIQNEKYLYRFDVPLTRLGLS